MLFFKQIIFVFLLPLLAFAQNIDYTFIYESSFEGEKPYQEVFHLQYAQSSNYIVVRTPSRQVKANILNNYDLHKVTFNHDGDEQNIVKKSDQLIYSLNTNTIPVNSLYRTVVFPEFQIRDFINSAGNTMLFEYIIAEDKAPIIINARKFGEGTDPFVELTISYIPSTQWKFVYFFDENGWILKKEGYINSTEPVYSSILKERKNNNVPNFIIP